MGGDGDSLDHLLVRDRTTEEVDRVEAQGLFVLIGSEPRTDWLDKAVLRDDWGFLMTGTDLTAALPPEIFSARRRFRSRPASRACSPRATFGGAR